MLPLATLLEVVVDVHEDIFNCRQTNRSLVRAIKTSGCFSRTKAMTPFLDPVMTGALSQPTARQFVHGTLREARSASSSWKICSPVADPSQMGIDSNCEVTRPVSTSTDLMTSGNCLLLSSLLPSVDRVNAAVRIRSAKLCCCPRVSSLTRAVVFFRQHLMSATGKSRLLKMLTVRTGFLEGFKM